MDVRDELQTHIYGNNGEKMKWPEENNEKRNEEKRDVHCADKITFIFSASSKRFRSYSHWQTSTYFFFCSFLLCTFAIKSSFDDLYCSRLPATKYSFQSDVHAIVRQTKQNKTE